MQRCESQSIGNEVQAAANCSAAAVRRMHGAKCRGSSHCGGGYRRRSIRRSRSATGRVAGARRAPGRRRSGGAGTRRGQSQRGGRAALVGRRCHGFRRSGLWSPGEGRANPTARGSAPSNA
eukprot:3783507-Prymnesium_polylepis.1